MRLLLLLLLGAERSTAKVQIDGDVMLGGLFPIHSGAVGGDSSCGRAVSELGIQRMEAMIFTLLELNERQRSLLRYGKHRISLGGLLLDTCSKDTHALRQSLQFLSSSTAEEADFVCEYPNGALLPARPRQPIRGVVGGAYSQVSVQVANLLRLFAIPQISYASTSAALSDKIRFELFARTLPPDTEQAKALADIVGYFNWSYVSTVFSKGDYGEGGIQSFEAEVDKMDVCIAERLAINFYPTKEELDEIVQRLYANRRARVVVMFTREDHTEKFLDAVRRANITNHFVWISADGWGKSQLPVTNNSLVAEGALTLEISTSEIPRFNQYYTDLQPTAQRACGSANFTNPFFDQFWQQKFDCSLRPAAGRRVCNESLGIDAAAFKQEPKVQFVYDAVYTFAHGLEKVKRLVCRRQPDDDDTKATGVFQSCVRNITSFSGRRFYKILIDESNSFVNSGNSSVRFLSNGDRAGRYVISNVGSSGDYRPVGEWRSDAGLQWLRAVRWTGGQRRPPLSRCSEACGRGQRRVFASAGARCCWACAHCRPRQRVSDSGDECVDCGDGQEPTLDRRACRDSGGQHKRQPSSED